MRRRTDDRPANDASSIREDEFDTFVPEARVREEFDVTAMTLFRWDNDEELRALGWPQAAFICGRKYRSRKMLEAFKQRLLQRAIETRGKAGKPPSPRQAKINKRAA